MPLPHHTLQRRTPLSATATCTFCNALARMRVSTGRLRVSDHTGRGAVYGAPSACSGSTRGAPPRRRADDLSAATGPGAPRLRGSPRALLPATGIRRGLTHPAQPAGTALRPAPSEIPVGPTGRKDATRPIETSDHRHVGEVTPSEVDDRLWAVDEHTPIGRSGAGPWPERSLPPRGFAESAQNGPDFSSFRRIV